MYDFIESGGAFDAIVEHVRNTPEWEPTAEPPTSMPTSSTEIDVGSQEGGKESDTPIGIEIEEKCCEIAAKRLSQEVLSLD